MEGEKLGVRKDVGGLAQGADTADDMIQTGVI